ncbi:MAG: hypothetical protein ABI575_05950 [Oxalobacteraceae bacterium]
MAYLYFGQPATQPPTMRNQFIFKSLRAEAEPGAARYAQCQAAVKYADAEVFPSDFHRDFSFSQHRTCRAFEPAAPGSKPLPAFDIQGFFRCVQY